MRGLIILLLALINGPLLVAQVLHEDRIEIELRDGYSGEKIHPFGENGFVLSAGAIEGDLAELKFDLYGVDMKLEESKKVIIERNLRSTKEYSTKTHLYYLCHNRRAFSLISLNINPFEVKKIQGEIPSGMYLMGDMTILGEYAFIGAQMGMDVAIFKIHLTTGESSFEIIELPNVKKSRVRFFFIGVYVEQIAISKIQVLDREREVLVYVSAFEDRKSEPDTYVVRYSDKGEKLGHMCFTKALDQDLDGVTGSKVGEDSYIYTGTYHQPEKGGAEGIFFAKSTGDKREYCKFYSFLDLKNFFDYMPVDKKAKMERKKKRKESRGKDFNVSYQIATHDIIELDDGYLLIGEAYYPTYRTVTQTTNTGGVPTTTTRTVFDGYQYTHAFIAKFGMNGELEWDQSFEMWGASKPFYVKRFISIAEQNSETLSLVFASRNDLVTKSLDYFGFVMQDKNVEIMESNNANDDVRWTRSNLTHWFDNFFLTYGSQKIKNRKDKVKRKRVIYFVNKIWYE